MELPQAGWPGEQHGLPQGIAQVLPQAHAIDVALVQAVHQVFRAVPGIVQVGRAVIIHKQAGVNGRVAKVKQGPAQVPVGAPGLLREGDAHP